MSGAGPPDDAGGAGAGFLSRFAPEARAAIAQGLRAKLGRDTLSERRGPGGSVLTYVESRVAINLANDVFGFDNWNCEIKNVNVDFILQDKTGRYECGVTAIVRVTLRDNTYHEDVGYGHGLDPSQGRCLEKSKKQAVSDARKRVLRLFGDGLGNCAYNKAHVASLKSRPTIAAAAATAAAGAGGGGGSGAGGGGGSAAAPPPARPVVTTVNGGAGPPPAPAKPPVPPILAGQPRVAAGGAGVAVEARPAVTAAAAEAAVAAAAAAGGELDDEMLLSFVAMHAEEEAADAAAAAAAGAPIDADDRSLDRLGEAVVAFAEGAVGAGGGTAGGVRGAARDDAAGKAGLGGGGPKPKARADASAPGPPVRGGPGARPDATAVGAARAGPPAPLVGAAAAGAVSAKVLAAAGAALAPPLGRADQIAIEAKRLAAKEKLEKKKRPGAENSAGGVLSPSEVSKKARTDWA